MTTLIGETMDNSKIKGLYLRHILAKNLREHRKKKGISQEDLAEVSGLHRTYIGSVERSERNVTLSTLHSLAAALKVSPNELLIEWEVKIYKQKDD